MARHDPAAELRKAFTDERTIFIKKPGTVDAIANVHVNAESRTVDSADQAQIRIGAIGNTPAHHLDGEFRAERFYRVENRAAVFNGCIEELFGKILGVGTIPDVWI